MLAAKGLHHTQDMLRQRICQQQLPACKYCRVKEDLAAGQLTAKGTFMK